MGDFYETFFEDAKICSKVLDIVLTSKNKHSENAVPMSGIPYHSADKYITRLINNGYKVAIAEQISEPVPGKIVEREVVSIITPGTYIQENKKEYTYTMATTFIPHTNGNNYHLARGDFSIGEYRTKSFGELTEMVKFILTIRPVEIIFDVDFPEKESVSIPVRHNISSLVSVRDCPPDPEKFVSWMTWVQQITSYGKALEDGKLPTIALLLSYLNYTQKSSLTNITKISFHSQDTYLLLDEVTIKNLELLSSTYEGSEKHSLFHTINTTKTWVGTRLLRHTLTNPIKDISQLQRRLDQIERYFNQETREKEQGTRKIHQLLHNVRDIPKLVTTILYKKLLPSTFIKLRATLRIFFENSFLLHELEILWLNETSQNYIQNLYNYLEQLLKNDDDYKDDIDYIRDGYNDKIDESRKIAYHSDDLLLQYQQELANIAGIPNVKVKFVLNQWYFLEITNKDVENFEKKFSSDEWRVTSDEKDKYIVVRRNTLKWGQRYSSPYLENLETKILEAKHALRTMERDFLQQAKTKIANWTKELHAFSEWVARLDLFVAQALLAHEKKLTKPFFVHNNTLHIVEGRHPVIEEFLPRDQQFIANNLQLRGSIETLKDGKTEDDWFLHIITGPNMGGKSTYLRQNALIVLMAHCGLFVPAKECQLPLMDALFARIGSGDNITKNQSTFMTEMIEVANILNNASKNSFIIFDELWRGTATYDGLALTKAILEHLVRKIGAKTLIATHYHELIQLENILPWVKNHSVSVYETDKEVVFMKKIVKGWASKSYGLDVAKLAGIPQSIVEKAKIHLDTLEQEQEQKQGQRNEGQTQTNKDLSPFTFHLWANPEKNISYEKIKSLLESYDLNNITPLQALQLLDKIKDDLK